MGKIGTSREGLPRRRHKLVVKGIQHMTFERGAPETWILWRCKCGCDKRRVEKIDGQWTPKQLGYEVVEVVPSDAPATIRSGVTGAPKIRPEPRPGG